MLTLHRRPHVADANKSDVLDSGSALLLTIRRWPCWWFTAGQKWFFPKACKLFLRFKDRSRRISFPCRDKKEHRIKYLLARRLTTIIKIHVFESLFPWSGISRGMIAPFSFIRSFRGYFIIGCCRYWIARKILNSTVFDWVRGLKMFLQLWKV